MLDLVGYLGLGLNLFSMYSKKEYRLRFFSIIANFIYIIYGVMINALPLIIGSSVAVIIHLYRLYKLN
jgi:cytochrome bd-type quinol oxidase subunit 2